MGQRELFQIFPCSRRNNTSQTLCAEVEPADLCSFAVSYYSFMRRSSAVERCLANYFEMDAGCRMTRSIRFFSHFFFFFFQQTMPKVRAEWPEATGALEGHAGPMNCETDISHLLRLLTRPLRTLTDCALCLSYTSCYFSLGAQTKRKFLPQILTLYYYFMFIT